MKKLLPILILTLVAAAFRFHAIGYQSFWYDEAVSAKLSQGSAWDLITGRTRDAGNPPLYYVTLNAWSALVGQGDAALRALSALFGVLCVPLLYSIARRMFNETVGLVAAGILSVAPFHVYLAQEARTYTLVTFLALLGIEALQRALFAPRRSAWWILFTAATFLAIYAHYFAFFLVLAEVIYVAIWYRRDRTVLMRVAASLGVAALLYVTWLPALFGQATTKGNLGRSAETWTLHVMSTPLVYSVGTTLLWKDKMSLVRIVLGGLALLAFAVPAAVGLWRLRNDKRNGSLVLGWLGLPILLPLVVSLLLFPFYTVRYSLLASPAFYLAIAVGMLALPRWAWLACGAAMCLTATLSHATYFTTKVKHDWRGAVSRVESQADPQDLVLFDTDFNEAVYARYARGNQPRLRLLPAGSSEKQILGVSHAGDPVLDVTHVIQQAPRAWLVLSDAGPRAWERYERVLGGHRVEASTSFRGIDVRLLVKRP
ncbi:MAG: glycosyltransferase family 39 protein [Deltaproteobacteria bacterium]|nr:glycosyltransferase family 39 protein [Deltaproteobacteria bacterium]